MAPEDVIANDTFSFASKMIGDVVVATRNADGSRTDLTVTTGGIARGNEPAILQSSLATANLTNVRSVPHATQRAPFRKPRRPCSWSPSFPLRGEPAPRPPSTCALAAAAVRT